MELIKIGKVLKTHGFKGHLKVFIDEFYMHDFEEINAIFINQLPYFIQSKDINSDAQAILLLEDIDSKEKAQTEWNNFAQQHADKVENAQVDLAAAAAHVKAAAGHVKDAAKR